MRTLLTVDGKVVIAGEVYNYLDYTEEKADGCKRFRWKKKTGLYGGNKRFKLKTSFASYPWKVKIKSKIVSYKKKSNGKYKRYRRRLFSQVGGYGRNANCNAPKFMGAFKGPKKRKSLKAKKVVWGPSSWVKFDSGEVHGFATLGNEQYPVSMTLVW